MEQSVTKKMAKNVSWLFVGNALSGGLKFALIVYVARALGVAAFGLWQFAQAFLIYLMLLVDIGFSVLGTREIAKQKDKAAAISTNMFIARLIVCSVIFVLSLFVLYFIPILSQVRWLFIFTFLFLFYRALNADWVFQGLEKMEYISLTRILFSALSFALIVYFVRGPQDLLRVPLLQASLGIGISVIILFFLYRNILSVRMGGFVPHHAWRYFLQAIPLCGSVFMMQINNNMDSIMLGFIKGASIVGYYTAAYRIFFIYAGLSSLLTATALPIISRRISEDRLKTETFLDKYVRLTMWFLFPLTVLGFIAAPITVNLLFGAEYGASIIALWVLVWALFPFAIANIYGGLILIGAGHFKKFFLSVFAGAALNIILNIILIPPFSYVGAAVATITAQTVTAMLAFYLSKQAVHISLIKHMVRPLLVSLVAVVFASIVYLFPFTASVFSRQIISCFVFALACAIFIFIAEREFLFMFINEIIGIKKNVEAV
ncbi:MAG: flippase [Candidatus Margulisiibacteriota bacterium]|nr:flippase [Candidatus Margulisiibacteriota bacterium]